MNCLTIIIGVVTAVATGVIAYHARQNFHLTKELKKLNRISRLPTLNVNRTNLEEDKIIQIENPVAYIARDVYIGSFLFTSDGQQNTILYDEIQSHITKEYPVTQSNILKPDFRSSFECEKEDKDEYESSLKERVSQFISETRAGVDKYLVVGLRNRLMEDGETLLFYYKIKIETNSDSGFTFSDIRSEHFSKKTQLYQNSLNVINKRYRIIAV